MKIFTSTVRRRRTRAGALAYVAALPARAERSPSRPGTIEAGSAGGSPDLPCWRSRRRPVGAIVASPRGVILGTAYHRQKTAAPPSPRTLGQQRGRACAPGAARRGTDTTLAKPSQAPRRPAKTRRCTQTNDLGIDVVFRTNDDAISAAVTAAAVEARDPGSRAAAGQGARRRLRRPARRRGLQPGTVDASCTGGGSRARQCRRGPGAYRHRGARQRTTPTSDAGDLDAYASTGA